MEPFGHYESATTSREPAPEEVMCVTVRTDTLNTQVENREKEEWSENTEGNTYSSCTLVVQESSSQYPVVENGEGETTLYKDSRQSETSAKNKQCCKSTGLQKLVESQRSRSFDSYVGPEEVFSKPKVDGTASPIYSPENETTDAAMTNGPSRIEFRRFTIGSSGSEIFDKVNSKHRPSLFHSRSDIMRPEEDSLQYEDQKFPQLLQDSIRELALSGKFYDVVLVVDGQKFQCHRMILSAGSPYFRAMFCNSHRERDQGCIKIGGITSDIMKIIIRYAYTSHLQISRSNAQSVLEAASLLQFNRVVQACADYFASQVSVENAPGIMELALRHNLKTLLVHARLECVTRFELLQDKSDYTVLSHTLLESIISREDLSVEMEETVFQLVMGWCRYCEDGRKKFLPCLLRHVKFGLIDPVYFVRHVETDPLIACNPDVHDLMMECRFYHMEGKISNIQRLIPRRHSDMHQVFLTVGGCDKNDTFSREICVLDYQHKSRSTFGQLPNLMANQTNAQSTNNNNTFTKWAEFACCEWKGNLVISGGKETRKEAWVFLTSVRRWVELCRMNTGRWRHRIVACMGTLYAVGGYDGLLRVNSIEKYDSRKNVWEEQRPMREGVSSAAVCVAKDNIYVFGGGPSIKVATEKVQVYDAQTNEWRLSTPMPEPCKCINAVQLGQKMYVIGGTLKDVLQFDTQTGTWTRRARLNYERASCGLTVCAGKIFIVGGRAEDGRAIANVSYLDLDTEEIHSECNMPGGMSHHGCVTLQKYNTLRNSQMKK